jgi:hypothetical protein
MIDLHMHTTASDGRSSPADLVRRVAAIGIRIFSVTDHDTVAALGETAGLADAAGLQFVPGVEVTAVHERKDVHVLGYFVDHEAPAFRAFLALSLADRNRRARVMCDRLAELNAPIDLEQIIGHDGGLNGGKAIARPAVARALLEAGHVASIQEAFDRYLAEGRPAYVDRTGASPAQVVAVIMEAGGIASLAHPGPLARDELVAPLVAAGLSAIEVYHSEHTPDVTDRYLRLADEHGLAVTGGSDYHGEGTRRAEFLGRVGLPASEFARLVERHACDRRANSR